MTQTNDMRARTHAARIALSALVDRMRRRGRTTARLRKGLPWRSDGVLPPYHDPADSISRRLMTAALLVGVAVFCAVYGMAFGLYGSAVPAAFLMPIFVLAGFVLWALPETKAPPLRAVGSLFLVATASVAIWPNYLAIAVPGLPWITVSRTFDFALVSVFLLCISTSDAVRRKIMDIINASPWIFRLLLAFVAVQFLTIPASTRPLSSLQALVVYQITWTTTFFIATLVFSWKGTATRWVGMLCVIAVMQGFLSLWEHHVRHVLWVGHIPSFLQVSDPAVQRILTPKNRGVIYRSQGTFDGPIQLGEYLVLCFTFVLHFAVSGRSALTRNIARGVAPMLLLSSAASGSRSSLVGFAVATGLYALYVAARRWRERPRGLIAPIFVLSYPVMALAAVASTFFVHKLKVAVWGTSGANASSSEARSEQWRAAIPKALDHPWGYGAGQAADVVAYASPGADFYTIDCYYISLLIDYGVVGLVIYVCLFVTAALKALSSAILSDFKDWEITLLAPAGVSMISFLVIKGVFNQVDNHILFFSILGMICALLWRAKAEAPAPAPASGRKATAPAVGRFRTA